MGRVKLALHFKDTCFICLESHHFFFPFADYFCDLVIRDKEAVIAAWDVVDGEPKST